MKIKKLMLVSGVPSPRSKARSVHSSELVKPYSFYVNRVEECTRPVRHLKIICVLFYLIIVIYSLFKYLKFEIFISGFEIRNWIRNTNLSSD